MRIKHQTLLSILLLSPVLLTAAVPTPGIVLTGSNTLNGGGSIIDGTSAFTGYFLMGPGDLNFSNVTLQNFTTVGGTGSGGGAGFGGAIFITNGTLTLDNVNLIGNIAIGGTGGMGSTGGNLNNNILTPTLPGVPGFNGEDANPGAAGANSGNGVGGYNGYDGGFGATGPGGRGGDGGAGGPGSDSNAFIAYLTAQGVIQLAQNIYTLSQAAAESDEAANANMFAAQFGEISGSFGDLAGAMAGVGGALDGGGAAAIPAGIPYAIDLGAEVGAVLIGVGAVFDGDISEAFGVLSGTTADTASTWGAMAATYTTAQIASNRMSAANAIYTAANAVAQSVFEVQAYTTYGASGIGGSGGNGGNGGNGSWGFGGGGGGSGGIGGDASPVSISVGGNGGSPGNGGNSPFGGGGGSGGNSSRGGANGSSSPVYNGNQVQGGNDPGVSYFGGGTGSTGDYLVNGTISPVNGVGGGGGLGAGGAIFIDNTSTLMITGPALFGDNDALGGNTLNNGTPGSQAGTDLFMMAGSTVLFDPGLGNTVTFNGTIADDSYESIFSNADWASGSGAGLTVNSGLVIFNGMNTYTGQTIISGGVLQDTYGTGVNANSNILFSGGVYQGSGIFFRALGTAPNRVQWTPNTDGGFAAVGGPLTVTLNSNMPLSWGMPYFISVGSNLIFGSTSATNNVTFTNPINLNGATQSLLDTANGTNTDWVIFTGVISNGALNIGDLTHTGTVVLAANNTYTGETHVIGGTLILTGSIQSTTVTIDAGSTLNDETTTGGFLNDPALINNGTLDLAGNETVLSLTNTGTINGPGTLTAGTYNLNNGSIINANLGPGTVITTGTVDLFGTSAASSLMITTGSILNLESANRLLDQPATTINGTMNLNGNEDIGILAGSGTIDAITGTLTIHAGGTFTGPIIGPIALAGGTLNLIGTGLHQPSFTVESGTTLNLIGGGSVSVIPQIIVDAGGSLNLSNFASDTSTDLTVFGNGEVTVESNASLSSGNIVLTDPASQLNLLPVFNLVYTNLSGNGIVNNPGAAVVNTGHISGFLTFTGDLTDAPSGTIHPGNSPGLITVDGNYTEGGTLILDIESLTPITGFSQIRVGGIVLLQPTSTLEAQFSGATPVQGDVYQVIANSSGGPIFCEGGFGSLIANANVVFDVSTGQLIVLGGPPVPPGPPGPPSPPVAPPNLIHNPNEQRAYNAIAAAGLVGPFQINSSLFGGQLLLEILRDGPDPLANFTPTYYGAFADYAFTGDRTLTRSLWDRISTFRQPVSCCSMEPWTNKVSILTGYIYNKAKSQNNGAIITRSDLYVGADLMPMPGFSFGAAVSGNLGHIDAHLGKSEEEGLASLVYTRKTIGPHLIGVASLIYSSTSNHVHRHTLNGKVTGSAEALALTTNLGVQYQTLRYRMVTINPRFNLTYSSATVSGFNEKGAVNALYNNGYSSYLLTGDLSLSTLYCTQFACRDFNVELVLGIEQALATHKSHMHLSFVQDSSIKYYIAMAAKNQTWFNYKLNVSYNVWNESTLYANFEGLAGGEWSNSFTLGFRFGL
ncbi:MAG: hypothetical protein ABSA17_03090 [Rhabdochlamydiaceae bacterium]